MEKLRTYFQAGGGGQRAFPNLLFLVSFSVPKYHVLERHILIVLKMRCLYIQKYRSQYMLKIQMLYNVCERLMYLEHLRASNMLM